MGMINKAILTKKKQLTGKMWLFEFRFDTDFIFKAGQYVSIKVSEKGERRAYSVAGRKSKREIVLLVDVSPMGIGSKFLLNLKVGGHVEMLGPLGRFVIGENRKGKRLLFLGTGSGIAPLKMMTEDLLKEGGDKREIRLMWGLRYEKDIFWREKFERLDEKYGNFSFDLVLSKPSGKWKGGKGHVTSLMKKQIKDWRNWEVYLCGNPSMLEEARGYFKTMGVDKERVHFERYY